MSERGREKERASPSYRAETIGDRRPSAVHGCGRRKMILFSEKQREFYKNAKYVNKYKKSLKQQDQELGPSSSATKLIEVGLFLIVIKPFNQIEIKPEIIGHYLAEFSISYKHVKHRRPGIGATHSSRFIPLK